MGSSTARRSPASRRDALPPKFIPRTGFRVQAGVGIVATMVYTVPFLDPGPGPLHPSLSVPHEFTPDLGTRHFDPRRLAESLEPAAGECRPCRPRQDGRDQA